MTGESFFTDKRRGAEDRFFYYVGNIACDISGITRKSTAENPIGAADFLREMDIAWSMDGERPAYRK